MLTGLHSLPSSSLSCCRCCSLSRPPISPLTPQQVGERCSQLRALDCTVARRAGGLLLMGEEPDQLGFRALFTIAANCPLLEVRVRCL